MYITREKAIRVGLFGLVIIVCLAIASLILNGINQFKLGSQLTSINQASNLSHLLVRQQARLFSTLIVKKAKTDELIEALDAFVKEEFIIDANLYDPKGSLLAQSHNALAFNPKQNLTDHSHNTQQIVEPVYAKQNLIGFLRVTFDMEYGQTTQNKVNQLFHLLYGQLIILFLAGGLFVSGCYHFKYKPTHLIHFTKPRLTENRSKSQRFHSRRRAFQRK